MRATASVCGAAVSLLTLGVASAQTAPPVGPAPAAPAPANPSSPAPASAPHGLKLSGYVQGRYEWHQESAGGIDAAGRALNKTQFLVRSARLKAAYQGVNAEYVLQVETAADSVVLRDAEASLVDTWTPLNMKLTVGQFVLPFGYELQQSPADFVMPARAPIISRTFPGERDRGVRLQGGYGRLRFSLAVVNGNGIQDPIYKLNDQNSFKDVVGRVFGDFGTFLVGASAYCGRNLVTTTGAAAKVSGTDKDGDGTITGAEITYTPAGVTTYNRNRLYRLGADAQGQLDTPRVGKLLLRGELIWARDVNVSSNGSSPGGGAADPTKTKTTWGWYVLAVQDVGKYFGVALRLNQYVPTWNDASAATRADTDRITTLGASLLGYVSPNVKATVTYEQSWEQHAAVDNQALTFQLQARF